MNTLSKSQKLIYDMEKYTGGSVAVICGSMLIERSKNQEDLKSAINALYRINPALRTRIIETSGGVEQTVIDYKEEKIDVLTFENKETLDQFAETYAKIPIDIFSSLCEIKAILLPGRCGILFKLHHIISDAWSLTLICSQFISLLSGEIPQAFPYAQYLTDEEAYLSSSRYDIDKKFFLEQFRQCDEILYLSERKNNSFLSKRKTFVINSDKTAQIIEYTRQNNVSPFVLFLTATAVYMGRTKQNAEKFYIGTAVLNRAGVREKNTVGMFVNTVPVLMNLNNKTSFKENMETTAQSVFSVFHHQKFNYGDVLASIRQEYGFSEKLYDVVLNYQNAMITGAKAESTWYHNGTQNESLQIHIVDRDNEGIFQIHFDYQIEKFMDYEIESMYDHILNLLFDAIKNDYKSLYELDILSDNEKRKLYCDFNNNSADYPREKCVHQLFEKQVRDSPDISAVIACDRILTYRELNEQANRIANSLIRRSVRVGDTVAFMLSRKSYLISTILGILKTGAAYLPVDPDYPQNRIHYILEDSKTVFFITDSNIEEIMDNSDSGNPDLMISPENICYCIYTSGTTGNPKGTLLRHRNVVNYIWSITQRLHLLCNRSIVSIATVSFDIFITETLLPLVNGMVTILADESESKQPSELSFLLSKYPVDIIQAPPTKIRALIENSDPQCLHKMKKIILGGETPDFSLIDRLQKITSAQIYNVYGPSETTVGVTAYEIKNCHDIAIGSPVANTQIYIVDNFVQPVPIGVKGELCIAGESVGAGYLNQPELTAKKFIANPFGKGKLYKTGDLAYWRPDGNIVYLGRNDSQVKIRGLRIELEEIENALREVSGISQAVVTIRKTKDNRQLICAFYTGKEMDSKSIRNSIGQKLPKYMLPHSFTYLNRFPLTINGKIDRKMLPDVNFNQISNNTEYTEPKGEIETRLALLAEQVLGYTPVGREDDFFEMGGDSLKAIEFVSMAQHEGIFLDLQWVFDFPTVRELSEKIKEKGKDSLTHCYVQEDFEKYECLLEKNRFDSACIPKRQCLGDILLTGATGFLGIHILDQFMRQESGKIYCLVRNPENRLNTILNYYFGSKYDHNDRIVPVIGDLEDLKHLDIPPVRLVIHAAANVKHYGSYQDFYAANVAGTRAAISFAKKHQIRLIHISTLSVSGTNIVASKTAASFSEQNLYIGQSLDNVYIRSKFEAEKEVLDAMLDGLNACIIRVGNLTNRYSDGTFQKNYSTNAFAKCMKALVELGMFPDYLRDFSLEFSPVDEAASAVLHIAQHSSEKYTVFHLNNNRVLSLEKFVHYLQLLQIKAEFVPGTLFSNQINDSANSQIREALMSYLGKNGESFSDIKIQTQNTFSIQFLRELGFEWPKIDLDYIKKYADFFIKKGYWEV